MFPIKQLTDVEAAFPTTVEGFIPKWEDIPEELKRGAGCWEIQLFNDWFFKGLKSLEMSARENVDAKLAMRHIHYVMTSFEPSHEHKEAGVAFLLREWFTEAKWEAMQARSAEVKNAGQKGS